MKISGFGSMVLEGNFSCRIFYCYENCLEDTKCEVLVRGCVKLKEDEFHLLDNWSVVNDDFLSSIHY